MLPRRAPLGKGLFMHTPQVDRERQLRVAAKILLSDYMTDSELTAFTALDSEDCYEDKSTTK
jgi:hypothetical protein